MQQCHYAWLHRPCHTSPEETSELNMPSAQCSQKTQHLQQGVEHHRQKLAVALATGSSVMNAMNLRFAACMGEFDKGHLPPEFVHC